MQLLGIAMTPEDIFDDAYALGIVFYRAADATLQYYGKLPPDFITLSERWIPGREAFLEYLKEPKPEHRKLIAKAMVVVAKSRLGLPCIYRGDLIQQTPSCGCGALHKCKIYGECVLSGNGGGKWRVCTGCLNYTVE
jgi:hypothetical protein